jgi:hypothetical protein
VRRALRVVSSRLATEVAAVKPLSILVLSRFD